MSTAGWIVLAGAAWVGVIALVVAGFRRMSRYRGLAVEAVVATEMAGVDAEYEALVKGCGR